jgi:broad specificity phosphatase PhoE
MRLTTLAPALVAALALAAPVIASEQALAELAKPGRVLILRHATAPGFGDPPQFRLGDCATQRNLDEAGRAQARALGARLRAAGLERAKVLSSQWCRCLETARLLGLGPVEPRPALNSFHGRPEERESKLAAVRKLLAALPRDGGPVVLVTHQVTISGLTGRGVVSGGGYVLELNGDPPEVVATLEGGS